MEGAIARHLLQGGHGAALFGCLLIRRRVLLGQPDHSVRVGALRVWQHHLWGDKEWDSKPGFFSAAVFVQIADV